MTNQTQGGAILETGWLEENLGREDLRILDCTTRLVAPTTPDRAFAIESGRKDYAKAHIPGAAFIDVATELSAPGRDSRLAFSFPDRALVERSLGRLGVGNSHRVILYSAGNPWWATRVWWILKAYGFDNAAVLNGGLSKWRAEGRALSDAASPYPPTTFRASPRDGLIADRDDVLNAISSPDSAIIDALSRESFSGEGRVAYGRRGHIATAINISAAEDLVDPATTTFIDLDRARALFKAKGLDGKSRLICYCGGGIAASGTAFMLTQAGYPDIALYDNSLLEWGYDDTLPMETGPGAP